MGYPSLVPASVCKTDIHIALIKEEITEDGGPIPAFEADLKCNYQDTAKTVWTKDNKQVQLTGIAMFNGDICPELLTISGGTAIIFGVERTIFQGTKSRNIDGSVNFSELRFV